MSKLSDLTDSNGLKRTIASLLAAILPILKQIPFLSSFIFAIETAAGAVGALGVTHAAVSGELSTKVALTLSSLLSILVFVADLVPALSPYKETIANLAAALGAYGVGSVRKVSTVKNKK